MDGGMDAEEEDGGKTRSLWVILKFHLWFKAAVWSLSTDTHIHTVFSRMGSQHVSIHLNRCGVQRYFKVTGSSTFVPYCEIIMLSVHCIGHFGRDLCKV